MDNEWKNSLRERFSDYSAPEPEGLWEGIEQGIAGKPRRKMLPVWLFAGLAAAAAVALGVFLHPEKAPQTPDLQKQGTLAESVQTDPIVVDTPAPSSPAVTGNPEAAPAGSTSVPFAVASRHTLVAEAEIVKEEPVTPVDGMKTFPETITSVVELDKEVSSEDIETFAQSVVAEAVKQAEKRSDTVVDEVTAEDVFVSDDESNTLRNRFSIGFSGNGGQGSTEQSQGIGMNRTGEYLTRSSSSGGQKDVGSMVRMLSSNRSSTFEAHHSAPLRVGVTAAYAISPHVSLVSGLNWTYLESDFTETAGPVRTVTGQDLGYLGVPLRLEVGANVWKGLWLHAGAGGMVEKGLMSSSRTETWVDGRVAESKKDPAPDTGGLLYSVGASAGAEYRFNPSFGLYLSPGIEYHFDNGSEVRSAYTEKPLHWNVNLGVRFHFGK